MTSARAWVVVALMVAAATGPRAHAESAEAQVERLASEAVNAYRGADYNRAVELLTRAYEIRQVPALLYNLAKAYDKLGDVDHACDAYRRYADSADADPKLKAKADARLVVLDEIRRKKAAAAARRRAEAAAAAAGAAAAAAGAGRGAQAAAAADGGARWRSSCKRRAAARAAARSLHRARARRRRGGASPASPSACR